MLFVSGSAHDPSKSEIRNGRRSFFRIVVFIAVIVMVVR
jgi:hypothetical protein